MICSTCDCSNEMGLTGEGYGDSKLIELPQGMREFCEHVETVHSFSRLAQ
jgi:hypothetical protein